MIRRVMLEEVSKPSKQILAEDAKHICFISTATKTVFTVVESHTTNGEGEVGQKAYHAMILKFTNPSPLYQLMTAPLYTKFDITANAIIKYKLRAVSCDDLKEIDKLHDEIAKGNFKSIEKLYPGEVL